MGKIMCTIEDLMKITKFPHMPKIQEHSTICCQRPSPWGISCPLWSDLFSWSTRVDWSLSRCPAGCFSLCLYQYSLTPVSSNFTWLILSIGLWIQSHIDSTKLVLIVQLDIIVIAIIYERKYKEPNALLLTLTWRLIYLKPGLIWKEILKFGLYFLK